MSALSQHRTLALPKAVAHRSLTTLREKLIKIGAKAKLNLQHSVTGLGGGVSTAVRAAGAVVSGSAG